MTNLRHYAKTLVAVATFLVVFGSQVAANDMDLEALIASGVAALGALGVYQVKNVPPA